MTDELKELVKENMRLKAQHESDQLAIKVQSQWIYAYRKFIDELGLKNLDRVLEILDERFPLQVHKRVDLFNTGGTHA